MKNTNTIKYYHMGDGNIFQSSRPKLDYKKIKKYVTNGKKPKRITMLTAKAISDWYFFDNTIFCLDKECLVDIYTQEKQ